MIRSGQHVGCALSQPGKGKEHHGGGVPEDCSVKMWNS